MTVSEAGRKGGKKTAERHPKRADWGAGRPTDLTPELSAALCAVIRETACSVYTAALAAGVEWRTVYRWEQWGREGKQPFVEFCQAVMQARAEAELDLVRGFKKADREGLRSTQYFPFMLERRYPNEYGNRVKIEQQLTELSDADLQTELARVRSRVALTAGEGGGAAAGSDSPDDDGAALEWTDPVLPLSTPAEAGGVPGTDLP